jgi:hypothetical protein
MRRTTPTCERPLSRAAAPGPPLPPHACSPCSLLRWPARRARRPRRRRPRLPLQVRAHPGAPHRARADARGAHVPLPAPGRGLRPAARRARAHRCARRAARRLLRRAGSELGAAAAASRALPNRCLPCCRRRDGAGQDGAGLRAAALLPVGVARAHHHAQLAARHLGRRAGQVAAHEPRARGALQARRGAGGRWAAWQSALLHASRPASRPARRPASPACTHCPGLPIPGLQHYAPAWPHRHHLQPPPTATTPHHPTTTTPPHPAPQIPAKDYDALLVSYDYVTKVKEELRRCAFKVVVLDESHSIKNHTSERSKAALPIVQVRRAGAGAGGRGGGGGGGGGWGLGLGPGAGGGAGAGGRGWGWGRASCCCPGGRVTGCTTAPASPPQHLSHTHPTTPPAGLQARHPAVRHRLPVAPLRGHHAAAGAAASSQAQGGRLRGQILHGGQVRPACSQCNAAQRRGEAAAAAAASAARVPPACASQPPARTQAARSRARRAPAALAWRGAAHASPLARPQPGRPRRLRAGTAASRAPQTWTSSTSCSPRWP